MRWMEGGLLGGKGRGGGGDRFIIFLSERIRKKKGGKFGSMICNERKNR